MAEVVIYQKIGWHSLRGNELFSEASAGGVVGPEGDYKPRKGGVRKMEA